MKWLFILTMIFLPTLSFAHTPSDSYLHLAVTDDALRGQWDIALRDLDYAIELDSDDDGAITWGELRTSHEHLAAYALSHLQLRTPRRACPLQPTQHLVDEHSDGMYAVIRLTGDCPGASQALTVHYSLFFDLNPLHRGLLRLTHDDRVHTAVLSPDAPFRRIDVATSSPWREFPEFLREGVWHIWIGYDHVVFLISLLLPAALMRHADRWLPVQSFRAAFWNTFAIVTSFTVAHSITLSLAVLGVVQLPSRFVESVIAASVFLVALNNLYPLIATRLWLVTFAFGLIHGLGFASVLMDLGLSSRSLLVSLVGFNVGVEIGQLAIVSCLLPLAFWSRHSWVYHRLVFQAGSLAIVGVASVWLLERSLAIELTDLAFIVPTIAG